MLKPAVCLRLLVGAILFVACNVRPEYAAAAESYLLAEDYTNPREFSVTLKLKVDGHTKTSAGKNKATKIPLDVEATMKYRERRLPPAGRDAEALRGVRFYESAQAAIKVSQQTTLPRLRPQNRLMVAEGQTSGVRFYSPERPLYFAELELLKTPGDSLLALALLPGRKVEVGETWKLPHWAVQLFASVEAVEKGEITCTAESLDESLLTVKFEGEVAGANFGAYTKITLSGEFQFDVKDHYLAHLELSQKEEGTVGTVSHGLEVDASVVMQRNVIEGRPRLSDKSLAGIPLEPNPANLLVAFDSKAWNLRMFHDRLWHLFKQERKFAVFRLVEKGGFLAQCHITPLTSAQPGEHMPEEQFIKELQRSLGERFQGLNSAEQIKGDAVGGDGGLFVYRVESYGESNTKKAIWIHYLVAAEDGRQIAVVFTVGKTEFEKFANRDLAFVTSIEFLPAEKPTLQATEAADDGVKK